MLRRLRRASAPTQRKAAAPSPARLAPQRPFRSRVGEEEQGVRAAPDDRVTSTAGCWTQRTPCSVVSGPLRRLLDQGTSRRDLSLRDFAASGSRADARLVWPPARQDIRTAAPGSCA